MNLATLLVPERRATAKEVDTWFADWIRGGFSTSSGETVGESSAMAHSAYFACIRNIGQDLAKLPLKPYRPLSPRGKEIIREHPTFRLVHEQPNPEMVASTFWETIFAHALGYHGGFAEIEMNDRNGEVIGLWPLDPTRVTIYRNRETGELVYEVRLDDGAAVRLPPRKIFHIHGLGMDGITAHVIAQVGKESIGGALAAQRHTSAYFGNGAVSSGVIEVPGPMKAEALKNLRESFAERYTGAKNHYKPIILEQQAKWVSTSSDPEKSQLVETREFQAKDVARWFRMPPHKIGVTSAQPRANVEQENISYFGDTLTPWLVKGEQTCGWKLLRPSEQRAGIFYKYTTLAFLRGDTQQQTEHFSKMRQDGIYTTNDIRELIDMNPSDQDGADKLFVNGNMLPLEVVAQKTAMELAPPAAPDAEDVPPGDDAEPEEDQRRMAGILDSHEILLASAIEHLCTVESDKIKRAKRQDRLDDRFWEQAQKFAADTIAPPLRALIGSMNAVSGVQLNGEGVELVKHAVDFHMQTTRAGDSAPGRGLSEAKTMIEDVRNAFTGNGKTRPTAA